MVAAALADGTADRDCVFEVFARRLPHGRRYGVLAGTAPAAGGAAALPLRGRRAGRPARAGHHRPAAAGLAGRLPLQRRHRRLRRGRPLLPRLAGADRPRLLRRGRAAGDPGAVGAQPRQRHRVGRRPHGRGGLRAALHRDGLPAHARGGRRRRGPGRPPGRLRLQLEPRGRTALRRPDHRHQRARVHAAARRRAVRLPGAGEHPRPGDDAARGHLRRRPGHPDGGRGRRAGTRRDPPRLGRPADPRHARPASCSTSSARRRPASW